MKTSKWGFPWELWPQTTETFYDLLDKIKVATYLPLHGVQSRTGVQLFFAECLQVTQIYSSRAP